ncbi:hypothetical protein [Algicola sagamiensis]|uniref:hypothetical protein n=1 Tax=Algicola sagamiensis TaxID=163869 RepID=UPI0003713067|nr:hypothetical protein [Algicola sagamiensis]
MKTQMKPALCVAITAILASGTASALPDVRKGNPLDARGIQTPAGVGDIIQDNEEPKTLYVAPVNEKEINGYYHAIDDSGPMCSDLMTMTNRTYRLPDGPDFEVALKEGRYVNNLFQYEYAIPYENTSTLDRIMVSYEKLAELNEANAAKKVAYDAAELAWGDLSTQMGEVKEELETAKDEYSDQVTNCTVMFVTEPEKMQSCIRDALSTYIPKKQALSQRKKELKKKQDEIKSNYFSLAAWHKTFSEAAALITRDADFYQKIFDMQRDVVKTALDFELELLDKESGKIVGRATAGYNIYTNESQILSNALLGSGHNYAIKQLDLFNIRLNSGVTLLNGADESERFTSRYKKNVWEVSADTLMSNTILNEKDMPFEREERGDTIAFDTTDVQSFGSGSYEFYVTKRGRCGEFTKKLEEITITNDDHTTTRMEVERQYYEPHPNRYVFTQAIGLTYNYNAYPGRIRGRCELNIDRVNSYYRDRGRKKKRGFFSSSTRSWDHTRQTLKDDFGMECTLSQKPTSQNQAEARKLEELFERAMYDDLWQMFLAIYAKEFTVEQVKPDVIDIKHKSIFTSLGSGVMDMCGKGKKFCKFGSVVLKSLGELGGSKARGSTSSRIEHYGTIYKNYNKDTWIMKQGTSTINMKVCADRNQCQ